MEPGRRLWRVNLVTQTEPIPDDEVAALYARTCPRLIGLLTCIAGSRSDAEEIAQDAFVKLLGRWRQVSTYDDPEAWVRAVAVRMMISRLRRRRVAWLGLVRLAGGPADHPPPSPNSVAVAAALRTLPPAQRAVMVLHYAFDLPVEQVAAELKVPVGTVKSRLSRARAAVAPLLTDEELIRHV